MKKVIQFLLITSYVTVGLMYADDTVEHPVEHPMIPYHGVVHHEPVPASVVAHEPMPALAEQQQTKAPTVTSAQVQEDEAAVILVSMLVQKATVDSLSALDKAMSLNAMMINDEWLASGNMSKLRSTLQSLGGYVNAIFVNQITHNPNTIATQITKYNLQSMNNVKTEAETLALKAAIIKQEVDRAFNELQLLEQLAHLENPKIAQQMIHRIEHKLRTDITSIFDAMQKLNTGVQAMLSIMPNR